MQYKPGGIKRTGGGRVISTKGVVLVDQHRELHERLVEANKKEEEADAARWAFIGPLYLHGVKIGYHTVLYHTRWEEHLRADRIEIDTQGNVAVTFEYVDADPPTTVLLTGDDLDMMIEDGVLKDAQAIHDDTMNALANYPDNDRSAAKRGSD